MDELSKLKGEIRELIKTELDSMGCVGSRAALGCPCRAAPLGTLPLLNPPLPTSPPRPPPRAPR